MRKWTKTAVSVMFAAALIAGCSGGGNVAETGNSKEPSTDPQAGSLEKKLTISWVGAGAKGKIEDNNWVQQKLEQKFNVKLENRKVDINNRDQMNLMVASGEVPDASFMTLDVLKLYEDGLLRGIPKDMIQKYAPNYSKLLDQQPLGWDINLVPGKKDQYLSLTGIAQNVDGLLWTQVYRMDWLEKAGIKPKGQPTAIGTSGGRERVFFTKEAFTLEENEKIFEAFTNGDPDGNGKKDTYGLGPNNQNFSYWGVNYLGAYGVGYGYNLMEDGKLTESVISKGYKDFLKMTASWYKKGYVDPEFTTLNLQKSWEKFAAGKIGSVTAQYAAAGLDDWTMTRPPGNLISKDPNLKLLVTPPPIGPNGKQSSPSYYAVTALGKHFVIKKDVSDEELIRILQIFDYINFDEEALIWTNYGEEGTHFTWEGTPKKSAAKIKQGLPATEGNLGFAYYNHQMNTLKFMTYFTAETTMKLVNDYMAHPDLGMKMIIKPERSDYFNETKFKDLQSKYKANLDTIVNEFMFKSITGETDVDKDWDKYVQNWRKNGGDELLAEMEKSPKVSDLLKKK